MNNNLYEARTRRDDIYEDFVKKTGQQREQLIHDINERLKKPKKCIDRFLEELKYYESEKEGTHADSVKDHACTDRDEIKESLLKRYEFIDKDLADDSSARIQPDNVVEVLISIGEFIDCYYSAVVLAFHDVGSYYKRLLVLGKK